MKRIWTHISFDEYRKNFKDSKVKAPDSFGATWYELLVPAIAELRNEHLQEFIRAIDDYIVSNMFSTKKFKGTQILFIQEYIKRVENFEANQAILIEAIRKEREKILEHLTSFTGFKPDVVIVDDLAAQDSLNLMSDKDLKDAIRYHGQRSLEESMAGNRGEAAYHDKMAANMTIVLKYRQKRQTWNNTNTAIKGSILQQVKDVMRAKLKLTGRSDEDIDKIFAMVDKML